MQKTMIGAAMALAIGVGCASAEPSANGKDAAAAAPQSAAHALLESKAARYVHLRADIADIEAITMSSATKMRDAHNRLGSYDPANLGGAWMAYAALVAADTPTIRRSDAITPG